jgi:TRAP-type C4-dicarboxylate transport system permease small subunit
MADLSANESGLGASPMRGPLFYIGAAALLAAMGIETLAVIGRLIGAPLLGALEIIQTAILLAATSAMLCATLNGAHATVTFLTDRLAPGPRRVFSIISMLLSVLFFIALAAGALWLAAEYWHSHEESELLRIPFRPLRVIAFIAAAAIAIVFMRDLVRSLRGTGA